MVRVERAELAHQHVQRPAVVAEVVLDAQQRPALVGEPQQRPAHPRRPLEVDPLADARTHDARELAVRRVAQIELLQRQRHRLVHALDRLAVAHLDRRAQRLVAGDEARQRGPQRRPVELALEPQQRRELVGARVGVELLEQPGPPLRPRQRRERAGALARDDRRQHRPVAVDAEQRRELARRARGEHRADVELEVARRAQPPDQPDGEQRVAAEREEVLVRAGRGALEQPAHRVGDQLREPVRGRARRRARHRLGQRRAVDLAAARERQLVEHDDDGRHVGGRQPRGEVRADLVAVERGAGQRRGVGDQLRVAGHGGARDDRRLADARVGGEHVLDLPRLDADAADLDLVVEPAGEVQEPVGVAAHAVAGAVPAVDELLRGRLRVVAVAAPDRRPADPQLAVVRRLPVLAHDPQLVARDGAPDRDGPVAVPDHVGGAEHGRLRRPVGVDERDVRMRRPERARGRGREHVGAGHGDAQPGEVLDGVLDDARVDAGRDARVGHAALADQARDRDRVGAPGRHDDEPRPVQQRAPDLEHGEVERERAHLQHRVARDRDHVAAGLQQREHVRVRDLDALRAPGRARRVDHVRQPLAAGRGLARRLRLGALRAERQHGGRLRVLQQQRVARGRVGRVERDVGGAGAQDPQQRRHRGGRTLDVRGDHVARLDALAPQPLGDPVGAGEQLAVAQRLVLVLDRDGVRRSPRLLGDQAVEGRIRTHTAQPRRSADAKRSNRAAGPSAPPRRGCARRACDTATRCAP